MKLRTRLALTLGGATVALLVLIGWAQSRWHAHLRVEVLAEAALHRMESGGRERCEANPQNWPDRRERRTELGNRRPGGPRFRPPRFAAYDASFASRNPESPPFPPELARKLDEGRNVASDRSHDPRRAQIAVKMPWEEGPCAVVLLRTKGPPPWFSGATLFPPLLVALVVVIVALLAAGPIVRRVRQLTESVRRVGGPDEQPIVDDGNDELSELGRAFEQSRQTIARQLASLRDREAALRNYIANTTHDVMLPLSVLQGHLVALQQRIDSNEALDAGAVVPSLEEAQYLGSLLHNLNAAARLEATDGLPHENQVDLNRLVERVVDRHRPVAKRKRVALEVGLPETTIGCVGDLTLLEQALGNLVQNAVRYNRPGGHVAVVLKPAGASWTLEVIDDGPGIPQAERERVIEPSFRGGEARTRHPHGMGLGLHIVSDVAKRHGLRLELGDTDGGGLTARLCPVDTNS
jgi:signal transduction histidine kinase